MVAFDLFSLSTPERLFKRSILFSDHVFVSIQYVFERDRTLLLLGSTTDFRTPSATQELFPPTSDSIEPTPGNTTLHVPSTAIILFVSLIPSAVANYFPLNNLGPIGCQTSELTNPKLLLRSVQPSLIFFFGDSAATPGRRHPHKEPDLSSSSA